MAGRIFKTLSVAILGTLALSACRKVYPPQPGAGGAVCPQVHTPWPSLASSPWPMFRHDPQMTGRSPYIGPRQGRIQWVFKPAGAIYSAITIGPDSTIYFGVVCEGERHTTALYAVTPRGQLKWRTPLRGLGPESQPMVLADGTIAIAGYPLYLVGADGALLRAMALGEHISPFMNIGLDGLIYLVVDHDLCAVDAEGNVHWRSRYGDYFVVHNFPISPDGRTLYIQAHLGDREYVLTAVESQTGTVLWRFPPPDQKGLWFGVNPPVVDCNGNIYVAVGHDMPPYQPNVEGLWAVSAEGKLMWSYVGAAPLCEPALDPKGNLTFYRILPISRERQVLSLDCEGALRWERRPGLQLFNPVCDAEGVLYFCSERSVEAWSPEGEKLWSVPLQGTVTRVSPPAIGANGVLYVGTFANPFSDSRLYAIY